MPRYAAEGRAIDSAIDAWPHNDDPVVVLAKATLINAIYSTNIYDIWAVAQHIVALKIDRRLRQGDLSLVAEVAAVSLKGKPYTLYSFASKYCSLHEPTRFQIYDSNVDAALWAYKKRSGFASFCRYELREYRKFVSIVHRFREHFELMDVSRRDLDWYLWDVGKQLFT